MSALAHSANGLMTVFSVHLSSSSKKLGRFACSDIYLSLSASLNALAVGSLPCSPQDVSSGQGARSCHRLRLPPGRLTAPLGGALTGRAGRYNGRPVSKAT